MQIKHLKRYPLKLDEANNKKKYIENYGKNS